MKKNFFISIGIIALIVGIYGFEEYTRKNDDLKHVKADYEYSVNEFINEFKSNEKAATEKFHDKIIAVNGAIKEITKDDEGHYTIMIGEENDRSSVRCSIDPGHEVPQQLQKKDVVTIKGACTGFDADELLGSDVILNRCVIQKRNQK